LNSIKVIKRIGIKGDYFKTQVARCEMQKTVYSIKYIVKNSIEYRVSSEEKIKKEKKRNTEKGDR